MQTYEWDPALETGNATVDGQHKCLIDLLNELLAAEAEDATGPSVSEVLDRLAMYAATHFGEEESLMRASGFPADETEPHIAEHRDLSEKTRGFVLDYRDGKVESMGPVAEFLSGWLCHHIQDEDRRLIEFMRSQRESA